MSVECWSHVVRVFVKCQSSSDLGIDRLVKHRSTVGHGNIMAVLVIYRGTVEYWHPSH